jgi:hypothetical protein
MEGSASSLKAVMLLVVAGIGVGLYLLLRAAPLPTVTSAQPRPNSTVATGATTISASIRGATALTDAELLINGTAVSASLARRDDRHWILTYQDNLKAGDHRATVNARDDRGRARSYEWTFTSSGEPQRPRLGSAEPAPDSVIEAGEIRLGIAARGSAPIAAATLNINDDIAALEPQAVAVDDEAEDRTVTDYRLFAVRSLEPGTYRLQVIVQDMNGLDAAYGWNVTVARPGNRRINTRFVPEYGVYLRDPFLRYWREQGGADRFGEPIAEVVVGDNGIVSQEFERATFELEDGQVRVEAHDLRIPPPSEPADK